MHPESAAGLHFALHHPDKFLAFFGSDGDTLHWRPSLWWLDGCGVFTMPQGTVACSIILCTYIGGDHGLLERRTTAAARQRAGAQEVRGGLARAAGRRHREGYELGNALLLGHEGGGREARAPKAARANRRRSRVYWRIDRTVRRPNRDMNM